MFYWMLAAAIHSREGERLTTIAFLLDLEWFYTHIYICPLDGYDSNQPRKKKFFVPLPVYDLEPVRNPPCRSIHSMDDVRCIDVFNLMSFLSCLFVCFRCWSSFMHSCMLSVPWCSVADILPPHRIIVLSSEGTIHIYIYRKGEVKYSFETLSGRTYFIFLYTHISVILLLLLLLLWCLLFDYYYYYSYFFWFYF